jgi:hypothetical protein
MHIGEILTEEVKALAGDRYKRNGKPGHVRWTKQWGPVYIGEQKLPIVYQRVRDRRKGREVELTAYKGLQQPHQIDTKGYSRRYCLASAAGVTGTVVRPYLRPSL